MAVLSIRFAYERQALGDARSASAVVRSRGMEDVATAIDTLQDQIDFLASRAATVSVPEPAPVDLSPYRRISGLHIELTEDTEITADLPTAEWELLVVHLYQDETGGFNVTWDEDVFIGATPELGDIVAGTHYLFLFTAMLHEGDLRWFNLSEKLAYPLPVPPAPPGP